MAVFAKELKEQLNAEYNYQGKTTWSLRKADGLTETTNPAEATEIVLTFISEEEFNINTIKLPKKQEVTFDWLMGKLNAKSVYVNFAPKFKELLYAKFGNSLNVYPTSYGIGVFLLNTAKAIQNIQTNVDTLLNELGIKYTNEYSDAHYVWRYKISKNAENIQKIEEFIKQQ